MNSKKYIPIQDMMTEFGVSRGTIYNWLKADLIQAVKLGQRTYIVRESIENAIVPAVY